MIELDPATFTHSKSESGIGRIRQKTCTGSLDRLLAEFIRLGVLGSFAGVFILLRIKEVEFI